MKGRRSQKDLDFLDAEIFRYVQNGVSQADIVRILKPRYSAPTIRGHFKAINDSYILNKKNAEKIAQLQKLYPP